MDYMKWSSGPVDAGFYNNMINHETFGGSLCDENTSDDSVPAWESEPQNWDFDSARAVAEKLLMIDSNAGTNLDTQFQPMSNFELCEDGDEGGIANPRFKTEFCRNFREKGTCLYGDLCQFAHGKVELRQDVVRHSKYKTKLCQKFWIAGYCAYGPRCNFIHQQDENDAKPAEVSLLRPFTTPFHSRKNSESSNDSGFDNGLNRNKNRMQQIPTKLQVGYDRRTPAFTFTETAANRPGTVGQSVGHFNQSLGHVNQSVGHMNQAATLNANAKEFRMSTSQGMTAPARRPSYGSEMIRNYYSERRLSDEKRQVGGSGVGDGSGSPPHPEDNPISSALSSQLANLNLDIDRTDNSPWREIRF